MLKIYFLFTHTNPSISSGPLRLLAPNHSPLEAVQKERLLRLPPLEAEAAGEDGSEDDPGADEPGLDGRGTAPHGTAAEQRQRFDERDAAAGEIVHLAGAPCLGADIVLRTRHKFVACFVVFLFRCV